MQRRAHILGLGSVLAIGLVIGGGYVVNAATTPSTTITACSNKKTGALRMVSAKAKCTKSEKRVTWNVKGATGPQGLTGLTGPAGARGADGADGSDGLRGEPGADGQNGKDGQDGKDGVDGQDGAMGPAGPAGGPEEVDPNPHGLTYRMQIGDDPFVQVAGFTQTISQSGTTQVGSGGGAGKAEFGDVVATLPMNSRVLNQMLQLAKGTHVPAASLQMCKPGELDPKSQSLGRCTLTLELEDVMITRVDVVQDPQQATATVQLNFAKERVSVLRGTPGATSYQWDIAANRAAMSHW